MENNPDLFIEINERNYIFTVGAFDQEQKFRIQEKIITLNEGIYKNKFIDMNQAYEVIKKNIEKIEKKIKYIFKDVTIILDNFNYTCINISGFKRLNGSQVLKENISYILNSLKLAVTESEKHKTILHIFNSKSILDGVKSENLPIGLFGDFYSHELSFFLINNNDLNNIKKIFNKNNLNIKKIILKQFSDGTQLINKNDDIRNFFTVKIGNNFSHINYFEDHSYRYSQSFNFGTDIIYNDVNKICSLDNDMIIKFFSNNNLDEKSFTDNDYLENNYFMKGNFRKIKKKLLIDIVDARINEIVNLIFNSNINIRSHKKKLSKIYLTINDPLIEKNFIGKFKNYFIQNGNLEINFMDEFDPEDTVVNVANLSTYGWKKEAIPIVQTKNSLITRIFKSLFE
tara:strand:- start:2261 stop:3457 length:1197 start_codon:yes stop_codon:yes gene_type:complete